MSSRGLLFVLLLTVPIIAVIIFPQPLLPAQDEAVNEFDYQNAIWSMSRGDPRNSGVAESPPPKSGKLLWSAQIGTVIASAAASHGKIFVGTGEGDLVALGLKEGEVAWKRHVGLPLLSSPAIYQEEVLFGTFRNWKPSRPFIIDQREAGQQESVVGNIPNSFYAVNAKDGTIIWEFRAGGNIFSSPTVSDGLVYFGALDGFVYALEADTGKLVWKTRTSGAVWSSPAVSDGLLIVGSDDNLLYAIDSKTGDVTWTYKSRFIFRSASPAISGGLVFIGSFDERVQALDQKTGELFWRASAKGPIFGSPAVTKHRVLIGSTDGYMYAFSSQSGAQLWSFRTGDQISSSPVVAGNMVVFGSDDGKIYALDVNTGELAWAYKTNKPVEASPVVINGRVYIGSRDGNFYAIGG